MTAKDRKRLEDCKWRRDMLEMEMGSERIYKDFDWLIYQLEAASAQIADYEAALQGVLVQFKTLNGCSLDRARKVLAKYKHNEGGKP